MARNKWNTSAIFYSPFGHVVALAGSIISAASVIWDVEQDSDNSFSLAVGKETIFPHPKAASIHREDESKSRCLVWFAKKGNSLCLLYIFLILLHPLRLCLLSSRAQWWWGKNVDKIELPSSLSLAFFLLFANNFSIFCTFCFRGENTNN